MRCAARPWTSAVLKSWRESASCAEPDGGLEAPWSRSSASVNAAFASATSAVSPVSRSWSSSAFPSDA